ncbi:MAG: hypothetical protein QXX38_00160 [Candidatus Aenigmatarchaeota archaeon]
MIEFEKFSKFRTKEDYTTRINVFNKKTESLKKTSEVLKEICILLNKE